MCYRCASAVVMFALSTLSTPARAQQPQELYPDPQPDDRREIYKPQVEQPEAAPPQPAAPRHLMPWELGSGARTTFDISIGLGGAAAIPALFAPEGARWFDHAGPSLGAQIVFASPAGDDATLDGLHFGILSKIYWMPGREHPGLLDIGVALGFYLVSLEALALFTLYADAEGDAPTPRGPEQYDALARLAFYIPTLHTSQLDNTIIPGTLTLKPYVGVRFDRLATGSDMLPVFGFELLFTNDHRDESCLR